MITSVSVHQLLLSMNLAPNVPVVASDNFEGEN